MYDLDILLYGVTVCVLIWIIVMSHKELDNTIRKHEYNRTVIDLLKHLILRIDDVDRETQQTKTRLSFAKKRELEIVKTLKRLEKKI